MKLLDQLNAQHQLSADFWVEPKAATGTENLEDYGAPLVIDGAQGFIVDGQDHSIHLTGHGNGLLVRNSSDGLITGLHFNGPGQHAEPNADYYALVLLAGTVRNVKFHRCTFIDSAEHGIGYLFGARDVSDCSFEECLFKNIGNLYSSTLGRDGAAIACGGRRNKFVRCKFIRCLRGIELETGQWALPCCGNTILECDFIEPLWHSIFIQPTGQDPSIFHDNYIGHCRVLGSGKDLGIKDGTHQSLLLCTGGGSLAVENNLVADCYDADAMWFTAQFGDIADVQLRNNRVYGLTLGRNPVKVDGIAPRTAKVVCDGYEMFWRPI